MIYQETIKELNKLRLTIILSGAISVLGILLGGLLMVFLNNTAFIFLGIAVIIFGLVLFSKTRTKFKNKYKELFVKRVLTENFDNLYYDWKENYDPSKVKDYYICREGTLTVNEDQVRASYMGIPFEMTDTKVSYKSPGNNGNSRHYFFIGKILVFDIPNMNTASIQILSNKIKQSTLPAPAPGAHDVTNANGFLIRAVNNTDVQNIFTLKFIDKLTTLNNRFKGLAIHLRENKAIVAIHDDGKSLDTKSYFSKVVYEKEIAKVNKDIDDIKTVISLLCNLDPVTSYSM